MLHSENLAACTGGTIEGPAWRGRGAQILLSAGSTIGRARAKVVSPWSLTHRPDSIHGQRTWKTWHAEN